MNMEETETNKNSRELVRDENGRVVSGVLNPNGRPKKGTTLTDLMKEYLESENPTTGRLRKEEFVEKVALLAYKGDPTSLKLIWNYLDGMPKQTIEQTNLNVNAKGEGYLVALKALEKLSQRTANVTDNTNPTDNQ